MNRRDEMTITPRLRDRGRSKSPKRAAEDRATAQTRRRQSTLLRKMRIAKRLRRSRNQGTGRASRLGSRGGRLRQMAGRVGGRVAAGMKMGGRAVPILGWAYMAMEATIMGGQALRRGKGVSSRLVQAQDANSLMGGLDEEATAQVKTRQIIESNPRFLEMIARHGKVTDSIYRISRGHYREQLATAQGSDQINRTPDFDSADTLVDKLLKMANDKNIKELADEAADLIRRKTPQNKSGR